MTASRKKVGHTMAFCHKRPLWQQNGGIIRIIAITKALSDFETKSDSAFSFDFLVSLQQQLSVSSRLV